MVDQVIKGLRLTHICFHALQLLPCHVKAARQKTKVLGYVKVLTIYNYGLRYYNPVLREKREAV